MTATLFIENVCDYDISWLIIYFFKITSLLKQLRILKNSENQLLDFSISNLPQALKPASWQIYKKLMCNKSSNILNINFNKVSRINLSSQNSKGKNLLKFSNLENLV